MEHGAPEGRGPCRSAAHRVIKAIPAPASRALLGSGHTIHSYRSRTEGSEDWQGPLPSKAGPHALRTQAIPATSIYVRWPWGLLLNRVTSISPSSLIGSRVISSTPRSPSTGRAEASTTVSSPCCWNTAMTPADSSLPYLGRARLSIGPKSMSDASAGRPERGLTPPIESVSNNV